MGEEGNETGGAWGRTEGGPVLKLFEWQPYSTDFSLEVCVWWWVK